jgi:hypothetical protein
MTQKFRANQKTHETGVTGHGLESMTVKGKSTIPSDKSRAREYEASMTVL